MIYFENEMMKIENELSEISHGSISSSLDDKKEIEELESMNLKKKLEVLKQHLPEIEGYSPPNPNASHRMNIASIVQKKNQQARKAPNFFGTGTPLREQSKIEPEPKKSEKKTR